MRRAEFRIANMADTEAVSRIYEKIHDGEEVGRFTIGWERGVYPVKDTAVQAVDRNELFVYDDDGKILAAAIINKVQVDVYAKGNWKYEAPEDKVMVLHTLVVDPDTGRNGIGSGFVRFYEKYAKEKGCTVLRLDTNEKNKAARSLYAKHGYTEIGTVPCRFNGIEGVNLVLMEKHL